MSDCSAKWEIEVYTDERGKAPFRKWLSQLDLHTKVRVLERLNRIRDGNFGDCKLLKEGIYELRFQFGPGYRVYYGNFRDRIVLLLTGGDKGSQKRDISKAVDYWKVFKEANT